jgi:uncharacterized protein
MTRAASLLAAAWLWSAATGLSAQAWEAGTDGLLPIPPLTARVTDLTQTLAPAETAALEAKLADWETRTSNQLVVLMVPSTQQEPIEAYSLRVAEKWRIGRKGQDNGALFLIAKNDRKMRIEVGYGLEGVLPDVTANRIIREDVAPAFRDGKFAAGINTGVDRIIAVVGGERTSPVTEVAAKARRGGFDIEQILFVLFFVVPVAGGILRAMFGRVGGSAIGGASVGALVWLLAGSILFGIIGAIIGFIVMALMGMGGGTAHRGGGWTSTGGGFGGGSWGGGSSGGSGGGFSGGGGSFGGGGSSGSW